MIDGTYRWNIMSGFYLYDESGNKIRSIGTFEDIHEKKMSELERQGIYDMEMNQSLKLQDDLVGRVIVNVTKDFIIDYGKKSRRFIVPKQPSIKVFNEHIKKIVTHPEEQKKIDMAMSREAFLNAYQQGKEMVVKYSFLGDNHRMTYLQSKTKFVKHPKTDDLIAFINVYDVTKKEIYDRVIEKAVHTNYDVLVAIHTDDEQIELMIGDEYHNKHYVQNKSYSECLQSISKWLKQPEEKENYLSANSIKTIQSKLNLENEYMFSGVFVDPDRKREVRKLLRYQYLDQTKCIILATCEDVTSLYDKEIAQKRELIETLNKLKKASQAKNEFFSAISHDIRTPLNAVIGMTQLAMEDETNAKQVHESLEVICNASKQLLSLINDILDISQMESNKIVLNDNIFSHQEETSKLISKAALLTKEKNQCLHTLIQVEHDMCIGDNIRIHRIMDNLISNAVKYTPVGGDIRFEVTEESSAMSEFAEYSFIIEDNGIGMSEEIQKRIFEPFYHFSYEKIGQDEGIGLGLSIVKESVDLMNGTIEMTSKVGEGSKFQVRIPIRIAKKQQTVVQKPEESIKEKTKEDIKESEKENTEENIKKQPADWMERCKEKDIRVLVVEDHPINQLIIERMLENKEIPVTIAKNGEEGVRYFEEATIHPYTHILMDVQMPVMNGYEATKAIRNSNHPQAKLVTIIAMTAYAFHEDVTACLEAGMDAHLAKPVNMEQLYRMLYESASDKNSE